MSYAYGHVYWWLGHAMIKIFRFIRFTLCSGNGTSATCFISFGCCINLLLLLLLLVMCLAPGKSGFGQPQKCVCHCQNLRLCKGFSHWVNALIDTTIEQHTKLEIHADFRNEKVFFLLLLPKRLSLSTRVQEANFISINFLAHFILQNDICGSRLSTFNWFSALFK